MSNPDESRVSFAVTQQPNGLYNINVQMSECTPGRAYEILKRVEIAVSNLPILEDMNNSTSEKSSTIDD